MRFQFQIDNRPAGPVHKDWGLAAQDAVAQGHAFWIDERAIQMDDQGSIARWEE